MHEYTRYHLKTRDSSAIFDDDDGSDLIELNVYYTWEICSNFSAVSLRLHQFNYVDVKVTKVPNTEKSYKSL